MKTKTKTKRDYQPCTRCGTRTTSRLSGDPCCVTHQMCGVCFERPARQYLPRTKKPACAACNMAYRRR